MDTHGRRVTRTNIEIDDALMQTAMAAAGTTTKRATVEEALRLLVRIKHQQEILKFRGVVQWEGDLDAWRQDRSWDAPKP